MFGASLAEIRITFVPDLAEYLTLAEMLTQVPMKSFGVGLIRSLTSEDEKLLKTRAKNHFDEIMAVLTKLPKSVILILR